MENNGTKLTAMYTKYHCAEIVQLHVYVSVYILTKNEKVQEGSLCLGFTEEFDTDYVYKLKLYFVFTQYV